MEQNNSDTNLSYVHCGLGMMSSVVSHCSQRNIHKSRILIVKKKKTVFWGTLDVYVSISKNTHITTKSDGKH